MKQQSRPVPDRIKFPIMGFFWFIASIAGLWFVVRPRRTCANCRKFLSVFLASNGFSFSLLNGGGFVVAFITNGGRTIYFVFISAVVPTDVI